MESTPLRCAAHIPVTLPPSKLPLPQSPSRLRLQQLALRAVMPPTTDPRQADDPETDASSPNDHKTGPFGGDDHPAAVIADEAKRFAANENSVLRSKSIHDIMTFSWKTLSAEVEANMPVTIRFMQAVSGRSDVNPPLCMALSMLLTQRQREVTFLQRLVTLLLAKERASKQTYLELSRLGLCQQPENALALMDRLAEHSKEKLLKKLHDGFQFRVVGDNVDFQVRE